MSYDDSVRMQGGLAQAMNQASKEDQFLLESPVVEVAVKVKDGKGLPKLVNGLKKLSMTDRLVICTTEENGEHVIAGCGELQAESGLQDLRDDECEFAGCGELHVGSPQAWAQVGGRWARLGGDHVPTQKAGGKLGETE